MSNKKSSGILRGGITISHYFNINLENSISHTGLIAININSTFDFY